MNAEDRKRLRHVLDARYALVHEYFRIDSGKVWQVAEEHIPALKIQLLEMLASHD